MSLPSVPNGYFTLPNIFADIDQWGAMLNANYNIIDVMLKTNIDGIATNAANVTTAQTTADAANTNANSRVAKAGDTMTGPLILPAADPSGANAASRRQYVIDGELALLNRYIFDTVTVSNNPGAGKIRMNNASSAATTHLFFSYTKQDGSIIPFAAFVANNVIGFVTATGTAFFKIVSAVDNTFWVDVTVVALPGATLASIAANAAIILTFIAPTYYPSAAYTDYDLGVLVMNTAYSQAHGLGALPSNLKVYLKCTAINAGYAIGDYVDASTLFNDTANSHNGASGLSFGFNTTNVFVATNSEGNPTLTNKAGTSAYDNTHITLASWHVVARVWS